MMGAAKTAAAVALVATAAALCLPVPTPTETVPAPTETVAAPTTADVAGTIRWTSPTTWAVLTDAGHAPVGLDRVDVLPDRLRVHYTFTADKVHALQVSPDEQFTSASVRCGASVGLSYADVFCYMPGSSTPVDPALLTKPGGNLWVSGTFGVEEG